MSLYLSRKRESEQTSSKFHDILHGGGNYKSIKIQ